MNDRWRPGVLIPFERPLITGDEIRNISQAIERCELKGNGPFTAKCQEWIREQIGCQGVLMTHSGTAALEMASLLLNLKPGDEVILPSFTFTSTANAFLLRGATLVFADIRQDTLNIDLECVKGRISERTRAICLVHYGSIACDMDGFVELSQKYGIPLIEDSAHAFLARYRNKPLGSFGAVAALSFHQTKNFSAGEGGALLVNDPNLVERSEILWEKGTNRRQFFRGEVDRYTWMDLGSSFLASELTTAFLWGQLTHADEIQAARMRLWNTYHSLLAPLAAQGECVLPVVPEECSHVAHLYHILLSDADTRDKLMQHLQSKKIYAVFHYLPLHTSPMGHSLGYRSGDLPITESTAGRLLRLPLFPDMSFEQQIYVVESIFQFFKAANDDVEFMKAM